MGRHIQTWKEFLQRQEEETGSEAKRERLSLLKQKVYALALEETSFRVRTLYRLGFGDLLPPHIQTILFRMEALGLTGRELAQRIGVSPTLVSLWLAGKARPTERHLVALGEILSIPIEMLEDTSGRERRVSRKKPLPKLQSSSPGKTGPMRRGCPWREGSSGAFGP